MALANTASRYGTVTKTFHWLTAALILLLIPLGLIANRLPYDTGEQLATKAWFFSLHKTLGVFLFAVALARILWALSQTKPGPLHPERRTEPTLADIVHWLLYGSLVVVPLSGWVHHAATSGFAPIWWPFGQSLPLVPQSDALAGWTATLHIITTRILMASLALHIIGALKHHFVDKDTTLRRIWFKTSDVPTVQAHRSKAFAPAVAGLLFAGSGALAAVLTTPDAADIPSAAPLAQAESDWVVQDGELQIMVSQFGSEVTGQFADWTAEIAFDPDAGPDFGSVDVTVAIGSLTLGSVTDQAMGPDYFNAEGFPTATYAGPIVADGEGYRIDGVLTIKDQSQDVALPFTLNLTDGTATVTGSTRTDRMTYGIGEGQTDAGTLGFDVTIDVALTATRAD
jgi:cytochrome b561/polyisoprenoid-binding protein YceI